MPDTEFPQDRPAFSDGHMMPPLRGASPDWKGFTNRTPSDERALRHRQPSNQNGEQLESLMYIMYLTYTMWLV